MDMKKYCGPRYLKVEHVRDGAIQQRIVGVKEGKFGKPDLIFVSGDILSLNQTNTNILVRAFGPDSDDWTDKDVETFLGPVEYQGAMQDAVLVKPISTPISAAKQAAAAKSLCRNGRRCAAGDPGGNSPARSTSASSTRPAALSSKAGSRAPASTRLPRWPAPENQRSMRAFPTRWRSLRLSLCVMLRL